MQTRGLAGGAFSIRFQGAQSTSLIFSFGRKNVTLWTYSAGACLKRRHVYKALRPQSRAAARPKLISASCLRLSTTESSGRNYFFDKIRNTNLFGDYFLLTPTFCKKNFHSQFTHFIKKINFGLRPSWQTIVDIKPKLWIKLISIFLQKNVLNKCRGCFMRKAPSSKGPATTPTGQVAASIMLTAKLS